MIVVGLSGKIGTGKSTLAGLILERIPGARRASFGALIKDETAAFFGFPREWCDRRNKLTQVALVGEPAKLFGGTLATVRELIQWYGTDYRRKENPHCWLWAMDHALAGFVSAGVPVAVIDDVRMPEEAHLVQGWTNAFLYRLEPYPGWEPGPYAGHITETALDAFDEWDGRFAPGLGELPGLADRIVGEVWGL